MCPLPASGSWRPTDPVGRRQWVHLSQPLKLEAGGELPQVRLAYETWGELADDGSNAVLIAHALTGDSHVAGPAEPGHPTAGWWDGLVGPGRALDTRRWFVVAPNAVGGCQGSTGPSSAAPDGRPWGSRFPLITIRDLVSAEVALADALGVRRWAAVLGGSMGGMRALEWALCEPDRVARLAVFACGASASAEQIAWAAPQLAAIRSDAYWHGGDYYGAPDGQGPHRGLGVARRIAHLSYRSEAELATRFGRRHQDGEHPWGGGRGEYGRGGRGEYGVAGRGEFARGRYAVESYLDHHAERIVQRFDAGSYVRLTEAMNDHDVGRGRGGVAAALREVRAATMIVGVDSDRLYPLYQQHELADGIPGAGEVRVVRSMSGHDGFLIEIDQVGEAVRELLAD